jgi:hypothetical protein
MFRSKLESLSVADLFVILEVNVGLFRDECGVPKSKGGRRNTKRRFGMGKSGVNEHFTI